MYGSSMKSFARNTPCDELQRYRAETSARMEDFSSQGFMAFASAPIPRTNSISTGDDLFHDVGGAFQASRLPDRFPQDPGLLSGLAIRR
jgi:hypothetical protein